VLLDRKELYSSDGAFDPEKMIVTLKTMAQKALQDGFSKLAVTGELSWLLDYEDAADLILEYEWTLNEHVFKKYPISALCRYNLDRFSPHLINIPACFLSISYTRIFISPCWFSCCSSITTTCTNHTAPGPGSQ